MRANGFWHQGLERGAASFSRARTRGAQVRGIRFLFGWTDTARQRDRNVRHACVGGKMEGVAWLAGCTFAADYPCELPLKDPHPRFKKEWARSGRLPSGGPITPIGSGHPSRCNSCRYSSLLMKEVSRHGRALEGCLCSPPGHVLGRVADCGSLFPTPRRSGFTCPSRRSGPFRSRSDPAPSRSA